MNGWGNRYTSPGANEDRAAKGSDLCLAFIPGKQFCEQGQHHVDRPGYVTNKGWVCDECKSKGNDDGR